MSFIHHRTVGEGRPVVLLHGFCESNEIWGLFATLLSQKFQLIIPDLPGFGKSEPLAGNFSIDDVATSMWDFLDQNKVTDPVIVGHSLGGYVTLSMVNQRMNSVAGFSLFHSTAKADSVEKKANRDKTIAFVNKNGVEPYIDTFVPGLFFNKENPAMKDMYPIAYSTPKDTLVGYAAAMRDRSNKRAVLDDFDKPVLIIAGEKDEIIPLESLMDQAIQLRKGRISILSDTGHMGMLESTNRSVEIVTQFVSSCR